MAHELIANITIGNDFYGPDYGPLPDELAHLVTNPNVWADGQAPTAPAEDTAAQPDLRTMTAQELRDHADANGIDVPARAPKADVIAAINEATGTDVPG